MQTGNRILTYKRDSNPVAYEMNKCPLMTTLTSQHKLNNASTALGATADGSKGQDKIPILNY